MPVMMVILRSVRDAPEQGLTDAAMAFMVGPNARFGAITDFGILPRPGLACWHGQRVS